VDCGLSTRVDQSVPLTGVGRQAVWAVSKVYMTMDQIGLSQWIGLDHGLEPTVDWSGLLCVMDCVGEQ